MTVNLQLAVPKVPINGFLVHFVLLPRPLVAKQSIRSLACRTCFITSASVLYIFSCVFLLLLRYTLVLYPTFLACTYLPTYLPPPPPPSAGGVLLCPQLLPSHVLNSW